MKLSLPHLNKSRRGKHNQYFSPKYRKKFIEVFERDFVTLNYEYEL